MEIRQAAVGDIPKIVALLRASLGEALMPKTEQYWRWKHIENPFGYSPVLVCWEGDELVGVRAFMQWKFVSQGSVFSAVRAVDTATHPAHQGKGIFRKLTLQLVSSCEQEGNHFVFNTPNGQSKPGYLKMGWIEAGRLPLYLEINRPIQLIRNLYAKPEVLKTDNRSIAYYLAHNKLESLLANHTRQAVGIITKVSLPYLKWRYLEVPVANYVAVGEERDGDLVGLIIARVKHTRLGNELRITDAFWAGQFPSKILIRQVKELKKKWSIDYCTLSGAMTNHSKHILGHFAVNLPIGPIVTLRSLALKNLSSFKNFKNWSPALGDLELF